ncbi:TetR/AcrR family transcriptional regulator [Lachnoclostridium sp. Marseille-P6806]|uniref:TetR/AcrR family transcriptional regulator n=1 Tax=Lachnoclostridium sp. Marseille-P6806 TaxID=2364793 RepID=UPI001030CDE1|nr:TetR/AcrR family transcriptional regulator [Lachnoclostridium sp. Marseille-P6806]
MSASKKETRTRILEATIRIFNKKSLKFTMDDIASELSISKKTIYTFFRSKEELFYSVADYCFNQVKEAEREVLERPGLSTLERLRALLAVLPGRYREIDLRQLYVLRDRYPEIFRHVEKRLSNDWEPTIELLQKGMEEGVIRPVSIPLFKAMYEAAVEQFFQRDILIREQLSYSEGLQQVVDILVDGIAAKP